MTLSSYKMLLVLRSRNSNVPFFWGCFSFIEQKILLFHQFQRKMLDNLLIEFKRDGQFLVSCFVE